MEAAVAYVAALLRHFVVRKAAAALLAFATGILMTTGLSWTAAHLVACAGEAVLGLWAALVAGARGLYRLAAFYWKPIVLLAKWSAFFATAFALGIYFSYDFFVSDPRASDVTDAVTDVFSWVAARAVGALQLALRLPNATNAEAEAE